MTVSPKDSRLMLLSSSILIVVPMVVFPAKLGTELSAGSFMYAIFEIIYYGLLFFIMRPSSSLIQLFQGAGLTFLYRIVIGTIFGLIIAVMYGVGLTAALSLGVSKYLPAIILHIAFAPFVIKPVYLSIIGEQTDEALRRTVRKAASESTVRTAPSSTTSQIFRPVDKSAVTSDFRPVAEEDKPIVIADRDANGFDRALKYISEHHAVRRATVVDFEGLTMASFQRDGSDIEDWAPAALLFNEANEAILRKFCGEAKAERLDLTYNNGKLHLLKIKEYNLLVLSDREDEDLLGIRLVQAADIISKYISERYDKLPSESLEEKYVPSP